MPSVVFRSELPRSIARRAEALSHDAYVVTVAVSTIGGLALGLALLLMVVKFVKNRPVEVLVEDDHVCFLSPVSPDNYEKTKSVPQSIRLGLSQTLSPPPPVYVAGSHLTTPHLPRLIIPEISFNRSRRSQSDKTPRFRIKRVPVPRLSQLPPTPLSRTPKFVKRMSRNFRGGLPSSVRPIKGQDADKTRSYLV
ncbi:hypothetical protein D9758_008492 [Tetrapyrgos nigripes]|uniref:Uncharacterized protein n=1 Tax=Tetrapyrgos nigripes TaxID=182062 RepID=A0A8H5CQP8_9AGAR|nr:hypothetical protein D9758_008492 [Tetrapyrgos nigripes]